MRRLIITLLAACLLGVGVAPALAQSPSPEQPPWFGGRVEMPDLGFAVTLPQRWLAVDLTGDLVAQARKAVVVLAPDADAGAVDAIVESWADLRRSGAQLAITRASTWCVFTVWAFALDTDSAAADFYERKAEDESVTYAEPPATVELAAGPAHLVRYARRVEEAVSYFGAGPDASFDIICYGPERPADDWRSVADSLEFLPAGDGSGTPFAPDDLASLLPGSLNGLPLGSVAGRGDELLAEGLEDPSWLQDVLSPLGKEPTDYHKALATTGDPRSPEDIEWALAPEGYSLSAIRVEGVPGEAVWDRMMRVMSDTRDGEPLPAPFKPPRTAFGRTYLWTNNADGVVGERWVVQYAKGEVLFVLSGWGGLTAMDVMADLP